MMAVAAKDELTNWWQEVPKKENKRVVKTQSMHVHQSHKEPWLQGGLYGDRTAHIQEL